jgi:nucleoside-diphosphate-sugar epimerase
MNILITGATGFIGRNLLKAILEKKWNPYILLSSFDNAQNLKGISLDHIISSQAVFEGNFRTLNGETIPSFDAIINLAASGVVSNVDLDELVGGNIIYTAKVLEFSRKIGTKKFIHIGSCSEYAVCPEQTLISENHPIAPFTMYGATKAAASVLVSSFSRINGFSAIIARPFNVFGIWESPKRLVPQVISGILGNRQVKLSEGTQFRDFIYVEDVAKAIIEIAQSGENLYGAYNLCTGNATSVRRLVETICDVLGKGHDLMKFGVIEMKQGENLWMVGDNKRIISDTNWKPEHSLEEGIIKTYEWLKQEGVTS